MEKVRFGLIGIGAQGGAYAGFLTGKGGMFGMPAPECPPHCALGALCDIDPEKEALCRLIYKRNRLILVKDSPDTGYTIGYL